MHFSKRLSKFDSLMRELIDESIEQEVFLQKEIAGFADIDTRKLKDYYSRGSDTNLETDVLVKLYDFITGKDFTEIKAQNEKISNLLDEISICCGEHIGDGKYELMPLLVSPGISGDKSDLRKLSGVYYVMRRILAKNTIMVSAISIVYDDESNLCKWDNYHKNFKGEIDVHGVITQSRGFFHFVGLLSGQSTLQSMCLPKGNDWNELSGIVLTQSSYLPIASRVVLLRASVALPVAILNCGEMLLEAATKLGLSATELLDNTCSETGVLKPVTDL
jgi:hypothetical protein